LNGEAAGALLGVSLEQWSATRPALTPENDLIQDVWTFCGGWNPAAVPAAAAFYGIQDLDWLISQLIALRDAVRAHRAAQDAANGK